MSCVHLSPFGCHLLCTPTIAFVSQTAILSQNGTFKSYMFSAIRVIFGCIYSLSVNIVIHLIRGVLRGPYVRLVRALNMLFSLNKDVIIIIIIIIIYTSRKITFEPNDKTNNVAVRPGKTQISLGVPAKTLIRPV